jgi:CheY-like chemotaxis protein
VSQIPTILLVEDDPNDVLLLKRALDKAEINMEITVVNNGEQAIAYLSGEGEYADRGVYPYPLFILLDLKLPLRSGFEVLAWIRETAPTRRLPVIVFTSSKQPSDINKAYELGANSYLVKPVSYSDLVDLAKLLRTYWLTLNQWPETANSN